MFSHYLHLWKTVPPLLKTIALKGGHAFMMPPPTPSVESQGCHLIPLDNLPPCYSAQYCCSFYVFFLQTHEGGSAPVTFRYICAQIFTIFSLYNSLMLCQRHVQMCALFCHAQINSVDVKFWLTLMCNKAPTRGSVVFIQALYFWLSFSC